jgi:hypothetical protein
MGIQDTTIPDDEKFVLNLATCHVRALGGQPTYLYWCYDMPTTVLDSDKLANNAAMQQARSGYG